MTFLAQIDRCNQFSPGHADPFLWIISKLAGLNAVTP